LRDFLMSSSTISTVSKAFFWAYPLDSAMASMMLALVSVPDNNMGGSLLSELKLSVRN